MCSKLMYLSWCCLWPWSMASAITVDRPVLVSYEVSALANSTMCAKKWNTRNLEYLNWNATDTWDRIPQGVIDRAIDQWQTRLCACVKAKGRHFKRLLWSRHTTGSFQSHLYTKSHLHTKTGSFQSHSHYWEEDNISFQFLCNAR